MREPCGLGEAVPLADGEVGNGLVVVVDGQAVDLGEESSVTLADDSGLSVYSDLDGDGEVDHVTTVRFDGSWESWSSEESWASEVGGERMESAGSEGQKRAEPESVVNWDAYSWEQSTTGRWG
nr:DUF6802 family protein [Corynebacterium lactis]